MNEEQCRVVKAVARLRVPSSVTYSETLLAANVNTAMHQRNGIVGIEGPSHLIAASLLRKDIAIRVTRKVLRAGMRMSG